MRGSTPTLRIIQKRDKFPYDFSGFSILVENFCFTLGRRRLPDRILFFSLPFSLSLSPSLHRKEFWRRKVSDSRGVRNFSNIGKLCQRENAREPEISTSERPHCSRFTGNKFLGFYLPSPSPSPSFFFFFLCLFLPFFSTISRYFWHFAPPWNVQSVREKITGSIFFVFFLFLKLFNCYLSLVTVILEDYAYRNIPMLYNINTIFFIFFYIDLYRFLKIYLNVFFFISSIIYDLYWI